MLSPDAIRALSETVSLLDKLGCNYYVGGSVASIIYGEPRFTRDIDLALLLAPQDVAAFVNAFSGTFYADEVAAARAVETGDCFNVIHSDTVFQVDVFTPKPSEWTNVQFERKRVIELPGLAGPISFYLCSPEDTILNKLLWYEMGNRASHVQWNDAIGVLKYQRGRLDLAYLEAWARKLGVEQLYRDLLVGEAH